MPQKGCWGPERCTRDATQQALQKAKLWQAGEDKMVEVAMAQAKEGALHEANQWQVREDEKVARAVAQVKKKGCGEDRVLRQ